MSWRFYSAWAFVAVLALVLPVAIPYAIWPLHEDAHADIIAECGRRAEIAAVQDQYRAMSLWPLSANVQSCVRDELGLLIYRAEVTAHGPYGIPFGTAKVSGSGITWSDSAGGTLFGLAALTSGVILVSLPFILALVHAHLRTRLVQTT